MPAKGQRTGYYVKCENCGKEIYQTKTQYNRAKHHFCSNKCQKEFQHQLSFEDRKCEMCGTIFNIRKKIPQRFCSIECQHKWQETMVGISNPRFTRIKIKCETCGKTFYQKQYKLDNGQHNFCSNKCRQKWYSDIFSQSKEWKDTSRKRAVRILEKKQINTNTKPQIMINNLLDEMNISYVNEKCFKYYAVDNYLNEYNLVIEVMGDFWHCHPLKYNKSTMLDIHKKRIPRDKAKHTYFKKLHDIEILYLWESDIYNNIELCRLLIEKYIKCNGILKNYHSFNYHIKNGKLRLNNKLIMPYQENVVNA